MNREVRFNFSAGGETNQVTEHLLPSQAGKPARFERESVHSSLSHVLRFRQRLVELFGALVRPLWLTPFWCSRGLWVVFHPCVDLVPSTTHATALMAQVKVSVIS